MILDFELYLPPTEHTPIEMFLAASTNCPGLELLKLDRAGSDPPNGHRDDCHVVVQLRKLRELFLSVTYASLVSCILSHVKYPESAFLEARVPACRGISLSETVSQVPPRGNPDILQ